MATATASLETTSSKTWTKGRLLVLGSVVVALIALQVFLTSYQPLVWGNTGSFDGGRTVDTFGAYPEPESIGEITLEPGKRVSFGFSVVNDGPLPLTIESVEHPSVLGLKGESLEITPVDFGTDPNAASVPFSATTIGVGEQRVIRVTFVANDCAILEPGGFSYNDSIPITYSTLWSTQTTEFPLPLRLVAKGSAACRA